MSDWSTYEIDAMLMKNNAIMEMYDDQDVEIFDPQKNGHPKVGKS